MSENELAKVIINIAYDIHSKLGPALLESVYEAIVAHELNQWKPLLPSMASNSSPSYVSAIAS